MSLTREQFYNKAIRPNLARFSSTVKVREILPHLQCLTLTDREEIEAKRETSGNFTAIQTLLDNLRRRENWPEEFINALRNCEHRELADEMKAAYDKIKGITNAPKPAPNPASHSSIGGTENVTKVTIHTVPPTTPPLLIHPQGDVPEDSTAPSNPAAPNPPLAPAPQLPETQQVPQKVPPVPVPSPEPVSQAQITPPADTPSQQPTPSVVSAPEVSLPVQKDLPNQTGAANNKTPVLNAVEGLALTNQSTTSLQTDETLLSIASGEASASNTSQIQITEPYTTSEKIQEPTAVKDVITSDKLPVQDTNPLLRQERTFQGPEEVSDPTANEHVQRNNTVGLPVPPVVTRTAQASSALPEVAMPSPSSSEQECFSKPGILQHPEPEQNRAETLPVSPEEPCSVVSSDLQFSERPESSTESAQSTHPAEQTSTPIVSNHPPNTAAPLIPNQPEENHYESIFEGQTLINVIQFAEEPPAENLNGQPPSMLQRSRVISEEQSSLNHISTESVVYLREPSGHAAEASEQKKSTTISGRAQESVAATTASIQPEQREEGRPELFRINKVHLIAAAGIGLSAVFLAWKLKH